MTKPKIANNNCHNPIARLEKRMEEYKRSHNGAIPKCNSRQEAHNKSNASLKSSLEKKSKLAEGKTKKKRSTNTTASNRKKAKMSEVQHKSQHPTYFCNSETTPNTTMNITNCELELDLDNLDPNFSLNDHELDGMLNNSNLMLSSTNNNINNTIMTTVAPGTGIPSNYQLIDPFSRISDNAVVPSDDLFIKSNSGDIKKEDCYRNPGYLTQDSTNQMLNIANTKYIHPSNTIQLPNKPNCTTLPPPQYPMDLYTNNKTTATTTVTNNINNTNTSIENEMKKEECLPTPMFPPPERTMLINNQRFDNNNNIQTNSKLLPVLPPPPPQSVTAPIQTQYNSSNINNITNTISTAPVSTTTGGITSTSGYNYMYNNNNNIVQTNNNNNPAPYFYTNTHPPQTASYQTNLPTMNSGWYNGTNTTTNNNNSNSQMMMHSNPNVALNININSYSNLNSQNQQFIKYSPHNHQTPTATVNYLPLNTNLYPTHSHHMHPQQPQPQPQPQPPLHHQHQHPSFSTQPQTQPQQHLQFNPHLQYNPNHVYMNNNYIHQHPHSHHHPSSAHPVHMPSIHPPTPSQSQHILSQQNSFYIDGQSQQPQSNTISNNNNIMNYNINGPDSRFIYNNCESNTSNSQNNNNTSDATNRKFYSSNCI